jgi:hypothetical protein
MTAPLPTISEQKRLPYRPDQWEAEALYRSLNKHIFDNELTQPKIVIKRISKAWGQCHWHERRQKSASWGKPGTWCHIELNDKWFCPQWFCTTLAHEMVHQYQWDIYRWDYKEYYEKEMHTDSGGHGPSFYAWRGLMSDFGIDLKIAHGQKRWFKYQDFNKC